ncbi:MAG: DUF2079 domain-containing protein [Cyanobacteria bacterium P01_A01_bin.135]
MEQHLKWTQRERFGLSQGAIAAAGLFWVLLVALLLHRHYSMYPSYASFDQGIFNQVFWNGSHGRPFQSSLSSTLSTPVVHDGELASVSYHRLGQHFTPALLLWLPLYALLPHPATLLVLQITLLTAAGLLLYRLARERVGVAIATMITGSFYAANAVIGPSLANFHDLCQVPLFLFTLFLALEQRRWWVFWLAAAVVLTIREDAGVMLFGIGAYLAVSRRALLQGLALCVLSLGYMLMLTNLVMPLFSEDISRRFMIEQFAPYVDGDEATTIDVIKGLLTRPGQLITDLVTPVDRTLKYLLAQWLPLAFVPAISPAAWGLTAFPLAKLFVRDDATALAINLRYALTIVPGLFYGAILWWAERPTGLKPLWRRRFWALCIGLSLLFTFTSNPNRALSFVVPDSFEPRVYIPLSRQWSHVGVIRAMLAQIPSDASVSATTHIVPHLSSRREIIRFPAMRLRNDAEKAIAVDYAVVDLWQLQQYGVAFADDANRLQRMSDRLDGLIQQGRYGLTQFEDGVALLQRGQPNQPAAIAEWEGFKQGLTSQASEPTA